MIIYIYIYMYITSSDFFNMNIQYQTMLKLIYSMNRVWCRGSGYHSDLTARVLSNLFMNKCVCLHVCQCDRPCLCCSTTQLLLSALWEASAHCNLEQNEQVQKMDGWTVIIERNQCYIDSVIPEETADSSGLKQPSICLRLHKVIP